MDDLEGRALDAAVAEEVMGWGNVHAADDDFCDPDTGEKWEDLWGTTPDGYAEQYIPPYSTSIEAAWEVVEKLREETWVDITVHNGCEWPSGSQPPHAEVKIGCFCLDFDDDPCPHPKATAPTAPPAICRAALKAVRQQGAPGD